MSCFLVLRTDSTTKKLLVSRKQSPPSPTWPKNDADAEAVAKRWFRDRLRDARAAAFQDAEAFDEIIVVIERLGAMLVGPKNGLGEYQTAITKLASDSPMAKVPDEWKGLHLPFTSLFNAVRIRRNEAFHTGAVARHLTHQAVILALILEESLMQDTGFNHVRDFMVTNPVCAELWQPLSFIRQNMLVNSFSYLPVKVSENGSDCWKVVSDRKLAAYFRGSPIEQRSRLGQTLADAIAKNQFQLEEAKVVGDDTEIADALKLLNHLPILVTSGSPANLAGILTAHDLL